MEDALISPIGLSILTGAGLIESNSKTPIIIHTTEQIGIDGTTNRIYEDSSSGTAQQKIHIELTEVPYVPDNGDATVYVMLLDDKGEIISEPYLPTVITNDEGETTNELTINLSTAASDKLNGKKDGYQAYDDKVGNSTTKMSKIAKAVLVDYYVKKTGTNQAMQIDITPETFGGNYYIEGSTLFRTTDGIDMPAEFIIPNGKVQSNFTFTMASSGDPTSFNFVVDAFPDYLRFDYSKKVLAAIQVITDAADDVLLSRQSTAASHTHEVTSSGAIVKKDQVTNQVNATSLTLDDESAVG